MLRHGIAADLLAAVVDQSQLEELAAKVWPDVVSSIDRLVARAEGGEWHTIERSSLSGDDALTRPFQTSHAVHMLLSAGIDALNGVRHLIWGRPEHESPGPVLHQAAHYVLARTAIENFATGLWILAPRKRTLRVERTLRWHVKNVTDQHSALDRLNLPTNRSREQKLAQLEGLVTAVVGQVPHAVPQRLHSHRGSPPRGRDEPGSRHQRLPLSSIGLAALLGLRPRTPVGQSHLSGTRDAADRCPGRPLRAIDQRHAPRPPRPEGSATPA